MKRNELLRAVIIMACIVAITVGAAIGLNFLTGPKIEEKRAAAAAGALAEVLPEGTGFEDITSTLTIDAASGVTEVHAAGNGAGYVFVASAQGFSQPVTVTVGVTADGKIAGIKVVVGGTDWPVDASVQASYVGQDSTLAGVIKGGATYSEKGVKDAVVAGLTVLAANGKMQAAEKSTEQVFEEELAKNVVVSGFVKGAELTVSGNIYAAYKLENETGVVCYVNKGEAKLLAVANVNGVVNVYAPVLLDEATQTYTLENVTEANGDVVTEVSAFAVAAEVTPSVEKLTNKVTTLYEGATEVTALTVSTFGTVSAAVSFQLEGNTYYAYHLKPINGFEGDVMDVYVILDSEGKIVKTEAVTYFYGHTEYFMVATNFDKAGYEAGLNGLDSVVDEKVQITGATHTQNAMKQALADAFAAFQGGNN